MSPEHAESMMSVLRRVDPEKKITRIEDFQGVFEYGSNFGNKDIIRGQFEAISVWRRVHDTRPCRANESGYTEGACV